MTEHCKNLRRKIDEYKRYEASGRPFRPRPMRDYLDVGPPYYEFVDGNDNNNNGIKNKEIKKKVYFFSPDMIAK